MSQKIHALLLTGVPGIGKTTVIRSVAGRLSGRRIRGFVTDEMRQEGRRIGFALSPFTGPGTVLAHVNVKGPHRVGRYGVDVAALDAIVDDLLAVDDATEAYLVDEIGKMECFSAPFLRAMRRLLDSGHPLVATVARRGGGFIAEVKERSDIELWEITRTNRIAMPDRIVSWLARVSRS